MSLMSFTKRKRQILFYYQGGKIIQCLLSPGREGVSDTILTENHRVPTPAFRAETPAWRLQKTNFWQRTPIIQQSPPSGFTMEYDNDCELEPSCPDHGIKLSTCLLRYDASLTSFFILAHVTFMLDRKILGYNSGKKISLYPAPEIIIKQKM
uniref:SFRICE_035438 n=1 Tax=Spodoptera frugiperda TaxID=7108 RepID=A0A2H1WWH3_SPOFR